MSSTDNAKSRKIVDVAEPGKTAATPSSRPIIVSNRPMLKQDPMVVVAPTDLEPPTNDPKSGQSVSRAGKPIAVMINKMSTDQAPSAPAIIKGMRVVAPMPKDEKAVVTTDSATSMPPVAETAKSADTPPVTATDSVQPAIAPTAATPPEQSAAPVETGTVEEDEADLANDVQAAPNKVTEDALRKAEEEQAAKLAEQEKVITSKQYYLPIKAAEARRGLNRILLVFVLVVLVALVWIDIVLDAGVLHIDGVHALTHFFSAA